MTSGLPPAILALTIIAAGCGGADGSSDSALPAPTRSGPPDCAAAGIDAEGGREGTCQVDGVVRSVADMRSALVIEDDIRVRLLALRTRARDRGRLVALRLRVTNLGRGPLRWPRAPAHVALYLRGRLIAQTSRSRAAAAAIAGAPATARLAPRAAGEIAVGWLLSARDARALRARGSAVILVPPSEVLLGADTVDAALRIGVLRLWQ